MMNSIAPVWDGNETWLVLGGGGLFAVFPLAYSVVMPALYMPIILMLLALVFRGVAFEYRWRTKRWKRVWDAAFFGGSAMAALMQGIALGALVQGIDVVDRAYAGGWWDWLTPFSVLTGLAVLVGYGLLGATFLILKTEGLLQDQMRHYAWFLGAGTLGFIGAVSLLTPFQDPVYFQRWFNLPGSLFTFFVPALVAVAAWQLFMGLRRKPGPDPVSGGTFAVRDQLYRHRNFILSAYRAAQSDHLGCRRARFQPLVHTGRDFGACSNDPWLYGLCLLGVSRQDRCWQRVSLGCADVETTWLVCLDLAGKCLGACGRCLWHSAADWVAMLNTHIKF